MLEGLQIIAVAGLVKPDLGILNQQKSPPSEESGPKRFKALSKSYKFLDSRKPTLLLLH